MAELALDVGVEEEPGAGDEPEPRDDSEWVGEFDSRYDSVDPLAPLTYDEIVAGREVLEDDPDLGEPLGDAVWGLPSETVDPRIFPEETPGDPFITGGFWYENYSKRADSSELIRRQLGTSFNGNNSTVHYFHPLVPQDRVVVRLDTVLVRDGVLRGLVQNGSYRLFAYDVVVEVGDGRWEYPLSVQPGEVAPFAIEGYEGPDDPAMIEFNIHAYLREEPDETRALSFTGMNRYVYMTWGEFIAYQPEFVHVVDPLGYEDGVTEDSRATYYRTSVQPWSPASHPDVSNEIDPFGYGYTTELAIPDLRVFRTILDQENRVLDVREVVVWDWLRTEIDVQGEPVYKQVRIDTLPYYEPADPDEPQDWLLVEWILEGYGSIITVGGA